MGKQSAWAQRLRDMWDRESEEMSLLPVVELCGDHRLLIENHHGVVQYGPEKICVRVGFGVIAVSGLRLRLCRMQPQQLVITGRIESIELNRGRK